MGIGAAESTTITTDHTSFGYKAAASSTIGGQSTSLGSWAGREQDCQFACTFVGFAAGYQNEGRGVSAVGRSAGMQNTGNGLSALGYFAGRGNSGGAVTAVGTDAGQFNTGNQLTAVGGGAGSSNEGDNVSAFGFEAGNGNIGDDIVALGYQAGLNNTLSNQFIVQQANVNATPLIQGDFSTGNIGIGTTTPTSKLSIQTTGTTDILNLFETDGSEVFTVLENGNVGIGNTNPTRLFSVRSGNNSIIRLENQFTGISNSHIYGALEFYGNDASANADGIRALIVASSTGSAGASALAFSTAPDGGSVSERLTVTSSGNVGIGTTSPSQKLSVAGGIGIGTPGSGGVMKFVDTNGLNRWDVGFVGSPSAFNIYDSVGGNPALTVRAGNNVGISEISPASKLTVSGNASIGSSYSTTPAPVNGAIIQGNVGIGTTDPWSKLEIRDNTDNSAVDARDYDGGLTVTNSNTAADSYALIKMAANSAGETSDGFYIKTIGASNNDMEFALGEYDSTGGDNERLRIDSDGNVGIGTTNPSSLLSIRTLGSQPSDNQSQINLFSTGGNIGAIGAEDIIGGIDFFSNDLEAATTSAAIRSITTGNHSSAVRPAALTFYTRPYSSTQTIFERMRITDSGNVGIGTTSPLAKLSVKGDGISTGLLAQFTDSADTPRVTILDNGRVGIGVTNPGAASLYVKSNTNSGSVDITTFMSQNGAYGVGITRDGIVKRESGHLHLDGVNDSYVLLQTKNNGNVGIGTTSPVSKLSVTGTMSVDGLTGNTGAGSLCLTSNNEVVFNSGSDACLPSLRESKHDIETLDVNALDMVSALESVSFKYNMGDGRNRYGFIAEDVADIDALLATYDADGNISGIDDRSMIAVVVQGMQEMWTHVQSLLSWRDEADEEIERLEARISALEKEAGVASGSNETTSLSNDAHSEDETDIGAGDHDAPTSTDNTASTTDSDLGSDVASSTDDTSASTTDAKSADDTSTASSTDRADTNDEASETENSDASESDDEQSIDSDATVDDENAANDNDITAGATDDDSTDAADQEDPTETEKSTSTSADAA